MATVTNFYEAKSKYNTSVQLKLYHKENMSGTRNNIYYKTIEPCMYGIQCKRMTSSTL